MVRLISSSPLSSLSKGNGRTSVSRDRWTVRRPSYMDQSTGGSGCVFAMHQQARRETEEMIKTWHKFRDHILREGTSIKIHSAKGTDRQTGCTWKLPFISRESHKVESKFNSEEFGTVFSYHRCSQRFPKASRECHHLECRVSATVPHELN